MSDPDEMIRQLVVQTLVDIHRQADEIGAVELRYEGMTVAEDGTVTFTFLAGVPVDDNDQGE